jgi:hypothetical protein
LNPQKKTDPVDPWNEVEHTPDSRIANKMRILSGRGERPGCPSYPIHKQADEVGWEIKLVFDPSNELSRGKAAGHFPKKLCSLIFRQLSIAGSEIVIQLSLESRKPRASGKERTDVVQDLGCLSYFLLNPASMSAY